jgi:hypothetical protein
MQLPWSDASRSSSSSDFSAVLDIDHIHPRVQQARKHAGDYDPPRLPSRELGRSPKPAVAAAALDEDVAAKA